MALHQLFTLAFALHVEPLATLDYAAVPYSHDPSESSDSLPDPKVMRVGPNTRLEAIHSRHAPHSIETMSFLLNYTRALDAVEPLSKLITLLDEADDDPEFRNLREFFDARYDDEGNLVGAEKDTKSSSRRMFRSSSRAASTKPPNRRGSQATEGRKSSFAASLGGASALKLSWLRKNNDGQHHDGTDDEDTHSHLSSTGQHSNPAPSSAPYLRLLKDPSSLSPDPSATPGIHNHRHHLHPHSGQSDYRPTRLARFTVRLDLHSVGLAAPPPKAPQHRQQQQQQQDSNALRRVGSGRSLHSGDWRRRRAHTGSSLAGGSALAPVASPDSMASSGALFSSADEESANHSGFSRLYSDSSVPTTALNESATARSRAAIMAESTLISPSTEMGLPSITEGTASNDLRIDTTPDAAGRNGGPLSPRSATSRAEKPSRRPSMISKLLDFGRKKSFVDRGSTGDTAEVSSVSPVQAQSDDVNGGRRPSATGHHHNFRSGLHQHPDNHNGDIHDEALDLAEEDEDMDGGGGSGAHRHDRKMASSSSRRRSSAGSSSGRQGLGQVRSIEPELRAVQEDGMLDIARISSRSSVGTSASGAAIGEDLMGTSLSAASAGEGLASRMQPNAIRDGEDFISLLREASNTALTMLDTSFSAGGVDSDGEDADALTPGRDTIPASDKAKGKMRENDIGSASVVGANDPSRTPQVRAKKTSATSTPVRSIKSLDLDRSPAPMGQHNPIDASFGLGASLVSKVKEEEAWWPCGDVDPLPVSICSAMGQALGWEGIMHLCYGQGSRAAAQGSYTALGRAAAMDEANKNQARSVLAWRTGVASAGTSPPKIELPQPLGDVGGPETAKLADTLSQQLHLDPAEPNGMAGTGFFGGVPASHLDRLLEKAPARSTTVPPPSNNGGETLADSQAGWQSVPLLFGKKVNKGRTWKHWQMLWKSIKAWVDEYETVRVRNGMAREMGLDPLPIESPTENKVQPFEPHRRSGLEEQSTNAPQSTMPGSPLPGQTLNGDIKGFGIGQPQSSGENDGQKSHVDKQMLSKVHSVSRAIPNCVLVDATNRRHGFRRRVGIPEGLPLGPDDEETIDYSWSRKKLSVQHFATGMTIAADSTSHMVSQLVDADWLHRSAWELDYLEMCVFKTPLVADRFPPPGEAVVPSSRSYRPAEGAVDRTTICPNPDENGAWDPDQWKRWLSSIREGDIIVPAIGWQAWWTLISVLNGADRTGRSYDLQVKTPEEPFEALTDLNAVYL
ncbi:hypothetical protein BCV70DRAFT_225098 [Testicularia cyperi]|uniref:Uncharacterized protein n=1 Tax=Testicularia cyperi TaxID=1882483 RepID=A0A317XZT7_9BASI|nr:hypothetical protein BCV70DRAFT_225098 [Testicularia cyperi]